jgi:hypothetical protein
MHEGVERINSSRTPSGTSPPSRSEMKKSEFTGRIVAEVLMTIEFSYSDLSKALDVDYKIDTEDTDAAAYGGGSSA